MTDGDAAATVYYRYVKLFFELGTTLVVAYVLYFGIKFRDRTWFRGLP